MILCDVWWCVMIRLKTKNLNFEFEFLGFFLRYLCIDHFWIETMVNWCESMMLLMLLDRCTSPLMWYHRNSIEYEFDLDEFQLANGLLVLLVANIFRRDSFFDVNYNDEYEWRLKLKGKQSKEIKSVKSSLETIRTKSIDQSMMKLWSNFCRRLNNLNHTTE